MSGDLSQAQLDLINSQNDLASRDPTLQRYSTSTGLPLNSPGMDDVAIQVGSTQFRGWQSVSITRSCEMLPNSFALSASTEFLQTPGALAGTRPEQPCTILIGQDKVITGWIDRRTIAADAHNHTVTITGRGITRNLVDCSADLLNTPSLVGGYINGANTLDLAQKLCSAFKLTARSAVADLGPPIPSFQVGLGETSYQIIESVARYTGYLVYEDQNGALVLDRIGTKSMASGFSMPGNIETILGERSTDGRFSHYLAVWNNVAGLTQLGNKSNQRALVIDKEIAAKEYRPRIIVCPQNTATFEVGQAMANWEFARRYGRSQAATITCDSWRDMNGTLWTPNMLATIDAPKADITGANWIIGTAVFRKDMSGTHADLVMMPPEAFSPEPNPLNLFDAQISAVPQPSQNPTPASTEHGLGWNGVE